MLLVSCVAGLLVGAAQTPACSAASGPLRWALAPPPRPLIWPITSASNDESGKRHKPVGGIGVVHARGAHDAEPPAFGLRSVGCALQSLHGGSGKDRVGAGDGDVTRTAALELVDSGGHRTGCVDDIIDQQVVSLATSPMSVDRFTVLTARSLCSFDRPTRRAESQGAHPGCSIPPTPGEGDESLPQAC